jgi:hypothetical protein
MSRVRIPQPAPTYKGGENMKKILFCLISVALLSFVVLAVAAKIDLSKPYIPTRKQWLQSQYDMVSYNFITFSKVFVSIEVLDDKIKVVYKPVEEESLTYSEVLEKKQQLMIWLKNVRNEYSWAKDLPIEIVEASSSSEK